MVRHSHLQNALIQLTYRTHIIPPGGFERFVSFKVLALVEQVDAQACLRMEIAVATGLVIVF